MSLLLFPLALAIYLLPTLIALVRRPSARLAIVLLNILLGWTVLVWLATLIWACAGESQQQRVFREVAESRLEPLRRATPSASLSAGRRLGGLVRRVRREPEPPLTIR